jgi:hypothetical protein
MAANAGMGNREKVAKINAELARLELEMELDHGGDKYMGSSWIPDMFSGGNTADATGTHKTAFVLLLESTFTKITTSLSSHKIKVTKEIDSDVKRILGMFKPGTGKAKEGHLLAWSCAISDRQFYILMRVFKGATQYTVVRVEGMALKDFAKLEYSEGASSDTLSVDLFIERIARAIVKGNDILSIVSPASRP